MASGPASGPRRQRLPPRRHRFVRERPFHVGGEFRGGAVAGGGLEREGLEADRLEGRRKGGEEGSGARDVPLPHRIEDAAGRLADDRRSSGEDAIERRPQRVDVAVRAERVEFAGRLLGWHVGGGADGTAGDGEIVTGCGRRAQRALHAGDRAGVTAGRPGQAPVHHERLPVLPQHHVAGLEVAMQDAAAVGVGDRLADVDESAQQAAELEAGIVGRRPGGPRPVEAVDGLLEAVAADESHRVERPAVGMTPQAVDRHDARMLEAAGDLRLEQKPDAAGRIVREPPPDLLERHLTIELPVLGHRHLAEPAGGMGTEDAEAPLDAGRGGPRRRGRPRRCQ